MTSWGFVFALSCRARLFKSGLDIALTQCLRLSFPLKNDLGRRFGFTLLGVLGVYFNNTFRKPGRVFRQRNLV